MQLTDYQKVDQLLKMGDLGASRSLELLAAMLELCPPGQETSLFFTHLFLCRLPSELRIMLGEDYHQDVSCSSPRPTSCGPCTARSPTWWPPWSRLWKKTPSLSPPATPEDVAAEEDVVAVVQEANRPAPGASSSLAVTTAANSIASSPSSLPVASQRCPPPALQTLPGWVLTCVSSTGPGVRRPATVWPPAVGRETRCPGACQCRCSRPAGVCH